MATRLWSVVFDASDHAMLARFWSEALGWRLKVHDEYASVANGNGLLPRLEFVSVPEPKRSKNRIHFDLPTESQDEQRQVVDRLIGRGATRIDIGQPKDAWWVVLGDPDGNEFCVVYPQGDASNTPGTGPIAAINYDAHEPAPMAVFWSAATGWPIVYESESFVVLRSPNSSGPLLGFASGPGAVADKPVKNRLHLDVAPFRVDDHQAEVARLIELGARRTDIGQRDVDWVVMADPEDNEFCVLTPR